MLLSKKLLAQQNPVRFINLQKAGAATGFASMIYILGVSDSVISYLDMTGGTSPGPIRMIRGWKDKNKIYGNSSTTPLGSYAWTSLNENLSDETEWCFVANRLYSSNRSLYASTFKINKKTGEVTVVNNTTFSNGSDTIASPRTAQLGDGRYFTLWNDRTQTVFYSNGTSGTLQKNALSTAAAYANQVSPMTTTADGKVMYVIASPSSTAQCCAHVVQNGSVSVSPAFAGGTGQSGFGVVGNAWYVITNENLTKGEGTAVRKTLGLAGNNRLIGVNNEVVTVLRSYVDDFTKITLRFFTPDLDLIGEKDITVPDECIPAGSQGFHVATNAYIPVNKGRYAYHAAGTGWSVVVDTSMLSSIL